MTHDLRLFADLVGQRRGGGVRLIYDDAERRLQRVGKIADLRFCALHNVAVRHHQEVEFLDDWRNLAGIGPLDFVARAAPDFAQFLSQGPQRPQAHAHLNRRRRGERDSQQRKGADENDAKPRDPRLDFVEARRDLQKVDPRIPNVGSGLDHV